MSQVQYRDQEDSDDDNGEEMLALNEMTGLVHDYKGTMPGGLEPDDEFGIGIIPCGCSNDEFEEAVESDTLTVIRRKHLERGIWEPAECLREEN